MKTKDLIAALQEADPSGEEHVCVENQDIHYVGPMPAYYDGAAEVAIRDPNRKECFDVVGMEIRRNGRKIQIHLLDLDFILFDDPEMPVAFDHENPSKHDIERIEKLRKEGRDYRKEELNEG